MTAARRTTRLRPIHFVLSVLLALAGVVAIGGPAQAVAGQIDGTLTDTTLAPGSIFVGGLPVVLYDQAFGYVADTTSSPGGEFSFSGLPDGDYDVYIDGRPTYMDESRSSIALDNSIPTSGSLGLINLTPAVRLTGTVRDPSGNPIPDVVVLVEGQPSSTLYTPDDLTDVSGTYSVRVPGGEEYSLQAFDINGDYWEQIYTHLATTCSCGGQPVTSVVVAPGDPDHTGLDFELHPYSHVQFDMLAEDLLGVEIPGLTIHLYKKVTGGWQPVEAGTTHNGTYDTGYATSYGPGAGDYRLRFSYGSTYVPVDGWFDDITGTGGPATDPAGCYIDFTGLLDGDQLEMELVFDTAASSTCGPQPAIVTPGGGTSTPPKKRTSTFGAPFALPTPTSTPTPTPTSSPTPSSSPSSEPSPSPTPTETPVENQGFDMWWLWLILAAIVALIIFFLVRTLLRRP